MINMFSQMACICHFVLYSCPAQSLLWVSGVGSFPVQSGGSLIIFQLFMCRNLVLNRFFPTFLEAGMFYTWGCLDAPTFVQPHMFICPPYICILPRGLGTQYVPHTPLCICMFSEASACCWGCKGLLTCWTSPYTSPYILHPHSLVGFPVHLYVLGISTCDMCNISNMWGFGGVPPSVGVWGHQHMECPYASSCTYL